MGNSEGEKPIKSERPTSPPREQSSIHVYPDWAAVQAYYGPGAIPPPYFNPAIASGHAAHPYMWAPPQMIPPYGSPYAAMYSHAGIYGPPAAAVCMQVATPLTLETPSRSGNDSGSGKKPKASDVHPASGNGTSNSNGNTECPRYEGIHGHSQSTECGTEVSCDKSEDSTAREDKNRRSNNRVSNSGTCHGQRLPYPSIDATAGNGVVQSIPLASSRRVRSTAMPLPQMNHSSSEKADANGDDRAGPCAPRLSSIGMQDEREIKREKRKQSNRESARRSRLRKQAEMEELGRKVDCLTVENMALRSEINKLVEDSEKLSSENASLMERLNNKQGLAGEMACDKIDGQEKPQLNTENLLSRVNDSVPIRDHERGSL